MSFDASMLKQLSAETLCSLLRQIPGEKDLVIEPGLMRPLDRVAGMTLLKSCGVARVFRLSRAEPPLGLRPEAAQIKDLIQVSSSRTRSFPLSFSVCYIIFCGHIYN